MSYKADTARNEKVLNDVISMYLLGSRYKTDDKGKSRNLFSGHHDANNDHSIIVGHLEDYRVNPDYGKLERNIIIDSSMPYITKEKLFDTSIAKEASAKAYLDMENKGELSDLIEFLNTKGLYRNANITKIGAETIDENIHARTYPEEENGRRIMMNVDYVLRTARKISQEDNLDMDQALKRVMMHEYIHNKQKWSEVLNKDSAVAEEGVSYLQSLFYLDQLPKLGDKIKRSEYLKNFRWSLEYFLGFYSNLAMKGKADPARIAEIIDSAFKNLSEREFTSIFGDERYKAMKLAEEKDYRDRKGKEESGDAENEGEDIEGDDSEGDDNEGNDNEGNDSEGEE